ncbi:recombinase family protein [Streptomyces netropsis]|nr:recombinase family protein [Streptomyces netropsis]
MELIMLIMRLEAAHRSSKEKSEVIIGAKRNAKQFGGWAGGALPYGMESYPHPETRVLDGKPVTIIIRLLRPVPRLPDGSDQSTIILRMVDRIFEFKSKPWRGKRNAHPASVSAITTWLNENEIPSQNGGHWRTPTTKRVLTDPRLAGFAAEPFYRKDKDGYPTRTLAGYKILRDPETGEPITIGEALIPPPRWFELQEWLDGRSREPSLTRGERLLTAMGKLKCECARPMTGSPGIYKCSRPSGVVEPDQHVGGNTINEKEVDEHVARKIMAVLVTAEDDPETLDILAEATRRFAKHNEVPEMRSERAALLGESVETKKSIGRLYDDLDLGIYEGAIGRARFLQDKEVLEERLAGIERRIGEVGGLELPVLPIAEWTYTEAPDGDPLGEGSWWKKADVADRRMLVSLFVDEIRVTKAAGRGGSNRVCQVEKRVSVRMAQAQREEAELDVVQAA